MQEKTLVRSIEYLNKFTYLIYLNLKILEKYGFGGIFLFSLVHNPFLSSLAVLVLPS